MPRSSRQKSSKHGSRNAMEYSDSERESGMRVHRKRKDESVASKAPKDSASSEKRKLDSKDGTRNGEYFDEYGSSKRRRERACDSGGERWNGGDDERKDAVKRAGSGDSKSRRRDESGDEGEEMKQHRDPSRKESREGRSERSVDNEELRMLKQGYNNTDLPKVDELQSPERYNQHVRQMRKKRDSSDGDKHQDDVGDGYDRRLSSRDEIAKDGRQKDGRRKDEKYRDKYKEDMDRENKHRHDKQQDELPAKDHTSIKFNDKHPTEKKYSLELQQKRTKFPESDHDQDRDYNHDRSRNLKSCLEREHSQLYERVHDHGYDLDRDRDYDRDRDHHHDRDGDCGHDHDHRRDCDGSHVDERSAGSKDSMTKKKYDDYTDTKSRVIKGQYPDGEKKSLSSSGADSDVDRGGSQSQQAYTDSTGTNNKHRSSPASNTNIIKDEYRYMNKIKSGVRRSHEIEESERRKSIEARDHSASDDRLGRELTREKPLLDELSQAESSFYGRTSQGNASLIPPPPALRAALERPFMGSLEDDVRDNSSTRYRSSDPGFGRGHGNPWRAIPNWTPPVPNRFVSFQPGPAHGGFQIVMPQLTSQPLFGVRPSVEVNHAGIPYHITDAERFPGHLRPLGWQNVMDGPGPSHLLHGWESNNGVFRDDPHMYDSSDWGRNRNSINSRGWESGSETLKELNCNSKKDLPSPAGKDESVPIQLDDYLTDQAIQVSQDEHNQDKFHEKSHLNCPSKISLNSLMTTVLEKVPDSSTPSTALISQFYLSKLDISADLVIPELYDQCMCLVNVDKNASIDADYSANLFQKVKNGSRARKIYAVTFSRHSPLPAVDNSIFQRAIDIYNKHKVELPSVGKADIISASNQVQVDESFPFPSLGSRQVSASASDGTVNVLVSTFEYKKLYSLSPAKEHMEENDQTCSQKGLDHDCTHSLKLVMSSPSSGHEKQREPVAGLCEKEDKVTSDKVNSGDGEENGPMALKNESHLSPSLHDDGDNMNSKAKITGFAQHEDQKQGFCDTMVSPLILEDDSPKACDALMPGSNESESLILSRIHHSPKSTH